MLVISETQNKVEREIIKASELNKKIYLLGGGSGASLMYKLLFMNGNRNIEPEAFVLNDSYYDCNSISEIHGRPVIPLRDLDFKDNTVVLVLGYTHYDYYDSKINLDGFSGTFIEADVMALMDKTGSGAILDYHYYKKEEDNFQKLSEMLADEMSRKTLEKYISQRINGIIGFVDSVRDTKQYFDLPAIDYTKIKGFVDCGAFDGDTYKGFLDSYRSKTEKEYLGRAWLIEPNPENIKKILANCGDDSRIEIIKRGAWKDDELLKFFGNGQAGSFATEVGELLSVGAIDDMIDGEINFIKMDIEGAEYSALLGAAESIRKWHPMLAICVYHKRDDLLKIPQLILSMYNKYKLYLRIYHRHASELVLYAIPEE